MEELSKTEKVAALAMMAFIVNRGVTPLEAKVNKDKDMTELVEASFALAKLFLNQNKPKSETV